MVHTYDASCQRPNDRLQPRVVLQAANRCHHLQAVNYKLHNVTSVWLEGMVNKSDDGSVYYDCPQVNYHQFANIFPKCPFITDTNLKKE